MTNSESYTLEQIFGIPDRNFERVLIHKDLPKIKDRLVRARNNNDAKGVEYWSGVLAGMFSLEDEVN
jgi:hypothetical protein